MCSQMMQLKLSSSTGCGEWRATQRKSPQSKSHTFLVDWLSCTSWKQQLHHLSQLLSTLVSLLGWEASSSPHGEEIGPAGAPRCSTCRFTEAPWEGTGCLVVTLLGISVGLRSHRTLGHRDAASECSSEGWLCKHDASLLPNNPTRNFPTK